MEMISDREEEVRGRAGMRTQKKVRGQGEEKSGRVGEEGVGGGRGQGREQEVRWVRTFITRGFQVQSSLYENCTVQCSTIGTVSVECRVNLVQLTPVHTILPGIKEIFFYILGQSVKNHGSDR